MVCFLWGFGTAVGELPPYFVARAAARSGHRVSEIQEVEDAEAADAKQEASTNTNAAHRLAGPLLGPRLSREEAGRTASPVAEASRRPGSLITGIRTFCCSPAVAVLRAAADRMKKLVYDGIKRYGFWAVLLAASVPNPFFDLAGLTCGHCGVPLLTFFLATVLGKAVVKVSMQASAYAVIFSPAALESLRGVLEPIAPGVTHGIAFVES